jgi:hypothetical protein
LKRLKATGWEARATKGVIGTFGSYNSLAAAGDFTASIDWGDGSSADAGCIHEVCTIQGSAHWAIVAPPPRRKGQHAIVSDNYADGIADDANNLMCPRVMKA